MATRSVKNETVIDNDTGREVQDVRKTMAEQTLAVDLVAAEIDRAIATAHKYPRSVDTVIKRVRSMACLNEEAAENCMYSLPRGGKPILGPSIGFAAILASQWGNCNYGSRPTYVDKLKKVVCAEGVFHDLETNARLVVGEDRRIVGKGGALYSDDMIIVTGKAAAAIALRNAVLRAVPRAVWYPIYEEVLQIVRGDVETFAERRERALKSFAKFGVTPEKVIMALGLKGEPDLTIEHVLHMRGMYAALLDGSETVETMFDPRRMTGKGFETVDNPLGKDADDEEGDAGAGDGGYQGARPTQTMQAQATQAASDAQAESDNEADEATQAGIDDLPAADDPPADPKARAQELARAQKAAQAAEAKAPVAEKATSAPKEQAKAEPTSEAAKPAAAATVQKGPGPDIKTPEAYLDYWEAFCNGAQSEAEIANKWSADRTLRGKVGVIQEMFTSAQALKDEAIAKLRSK